MKRLTRVAMLAVAAVTLASCSYVPTDDAPQAVGARNVPFNLLSRSPADGPNPAHPDSAVRTLVFVSNRYNLIASSRLVALPAGLADTVRTLFVGPNASERYAGYTTGLPTHLSFVGATDSNGLLRISISRTLGVGYNAMLAAGQIVLTASRVDSSKIEIVVRGHALLLPRPGRPDAYVLTAADYAGLVAP